MLDHEAKNATCLIERLQTYLKTNYQKKIKVSALADALYCDVSTLHRHIHKCYGMSTAQYITQFKISYAKDYLIAGETPSTVYQLVGFSSLKQFSVSFKRVTKITPTTFRNICMNEQMNYLF
jgi:AraC-like DNA-binding protein